MKSKIPVGLAAAVLAAAFVLPVVLHQSVKAASAKPGGKDAPVLFHQTGTGSVPHFEPDPYWPKPLPNNWILGGIGGVFVDSQDHVWVLNRPRSVDKYVKNLAHNPPDGDCCIPAPGVIVFDLDGNVIKSWGGPGNGYPWPGREHGIFVDYKGNVWIADGGGSAVFKYSNDGQFILQIGENGKPNGGSNDTHNFGQPTSVAVYPKTNEVFVADGYKNRRLIVFDADTGAYKRHWGAYGKVPDDKAPNDKTFEGPGPTQFGEPHGVRISNDGLIYFADRDHNRIQVFNPDGTFVKEGWVQRQTHGEYGTVFDLAFSPDKAQKYIYVPDGSNVKVQIVDRQTLQVVGWFGGHGGRGYADFYRIHNIACDGKNNVYLSEGVGQGIHRWKYTGGM